MKKLATVFLALILVVSFAACGKEDTSSGNDKTISSNTESDKIAFSNTSSDITANLPKESAKLIGKTVGDVKAVFGNDFKFDHYRGASSMEYINEKTAFILDNDYTNPDDSCKIRSIASIGETPLIDNLTCNLTYTDLLAKLGTSVITEQPKYWFDEMDGCYKYTLIFNYKGYRIDYIWVEDPNTNKPKYIKAFLQDDPYFRP